MHSSEFFPKINQEVNANLTKGTTDSERIPSKAIHLFLLAAYTHWKVP